MATEKPTVPLWESARDYLRGIAPDSWSFNDFLGAFRGFPPGVDVNETEEGYVITMNIPGVNPANLSVEVTGNKVGVMEVGGLTEHGHNEPIDASGGVCKVFVLPSDADMDTAVAKAEFGVLTITITKKDPSAIQPRTVQVDIS